MKRTKHSLSHYKLFTADMGTLVPVSWFEALPGDTIQASTSALVRVSPLVAPLMHPVTVRFHWWFVPNRHLWANWENFITGGPDGMDASEAPYIDTGGSGVASGSLLDYMGVPPSVADLEVSALPVRAYDQIYNANYRDQDLVTELTVSTADGADSTSATDVQNIAWEKDRFTAARPWTQKGAEVTLPLGTVAPVRGPLILSDVGGGDSHQIEGVIGTRTIQAKGSNWAATADLYSDTNAGSTSDGLYADLSSATAVDVNQVRLAFALQRWEEARAQWGSRYTEYLRYYGVRSSDARLQRPEYLGGGKQTIAFSEVLQSSPDATGGTSDAVGVGELKGHGISATRTRPWRRFFEEHGIVMCLMSVRPRAMYMQSLDKAWSRRTKEDYWQKELERIGQEEVYRREIFAEADNAGTGGDTVFGYNDRYYSYRHIPNTVASEFRNTLDYWHMARDITSAPTLNSSFVQCVPTDRVYASTATQPLWIMTSHKIAARRLVGNASIGRIF